MLDSENLIKYELLGTIKHYFKTITAIYCYSTFCIISMLYKEFITLAKKLSGTK